MRLLLTSCSEHLLRRIAYGREKHFESELEKDYGAWFIFPTIRYLLAYYKTLKLQQKQYLFLIFLL